MLVNELNIWGFRGIRSCESPIKLSKLNVLIGRNNSGKTSVLEALSLPLNEVTETYDRYPIHLLQDIHGARDSSFLLYNYSGEAKIEYIVNGKHLQALLNEKSSVPDIFLQSDGDKVKAEIKDLLEILGIESRAMRSSILYFPNHSNTISAFINRALITFERFVKDGAHVRVISILNRCIDEELTEVLPFSELRVRKIVEGKPIYPRVKDLGDGAMRFIAIALWLELLKPKLVLLDDIEASAHPTLIREMLSWLSEKEWQVVLTTHSIDVLHELSEIHPDGCKILQLKRKEDVLLHQSLDLDELEVLLENNTDPRILVSALGL